MRLTEWTGVPISDLSMGTSRGKGVVFFSNISKSGKANAPFSGRTLTASNGV